MRDTTDIWFAAFLLLKNIKVAKFDVISRGRGRYYFDLTDEEWKNYKLSFNNADDLVKYKVTIEQLKDLLF